MKKTAVVIVSAVLYMALFVVIAYTSCNPDDCKDTTCQNSGVCMDGACVCPTGYTGHQCEILDPCAKTYCVNGGTCNDGQCLCPDGHEGNNCEIFTHTKYQGLWTVAEDGTRSNPEQYELSISQSGTANVAEMMIYNLNNRLAPVKVRLRVDTLFIPAQTVNGYTVEGKGVFDKPANGGVPKITMHYHVISPDGYTNDFGKTNGKPSAWRR